MLEAGPLVVVTAPVVVTPSEVPVDNFPSVVVVAPVEVVVVVCSSGGGSDGKSCHCQCHSSDSGYVILVFCCAGVC